MEDHLTKCIPYLQWKEHNEDIIARQEGSVQVDDFLNSFDFEALCHDKVKAVCQAMEALATR